MFVLEWGSEIQTEHCLCLDLMWERLIYLQPESGIRVSGNTLRWLLKLPHSSLQNVEDRGLPGLKGEQTFFSSEHLYTVNMKKGFGPKVPVGKLTEVES